MSFSLPIPSKPVIIAVALLAWTVYQRDLAAKGAREACQSTQLQLTLNEITRQRDAAVAALTAAENQAKQTRLEMNALEQLNAKIKSSLDQGEMPGSCIIPDSIVNRLRDIK